MHILMNMYPWYLPKRNREWRTHFDLMNLGKQFPDMEFSLVNNLPAMVVGNGVFLMQYFLARTGRYRKLVSRVYPLHASTSMNWVPQRFIRHSGADLFFGHEYFPFNITDKLLPTVFETGMQSDAVIKFWHPGDTVAVHRYRNLNVRMKKHIAARCTLVNVREPSGAKRFKQFLPKFADKVRTVPPYLHYLEPISEANLVSKQHHDSSLNVLYIGNAARLKGLPFLVMAIKQLPFKTRAKIRLTVVSQFHDGSVDMSESGAYVINRGPRSSLKIAFGSSPQKQGSLTVSEVLALMQSSHIFVLPTLADTFGLVFLEAMASGCAVIGPKRDPQDWILDYGRAGLLVEPTNPDSIATALQSLIGDSSLRLAMALRGRQRFLDMYYHRIVAQQYRTLFEEAIEIWKAKNAYKC